MDRPQGSSRHGGPLSDAVSTLAAFLFGTDRYARWIRGRWWPRYMAVASLLAVIVLCRRPDLVRHPQFWAEDGFIYFRDDLLLGFPRAMLQLYQGFPHFGQRLIAAFGGLFPIASAPRFYTTAAIAIAALSVATFSLPRFRHLVESDAMRVVLCVACVCLPADQEVFATPANVGWFLGIWLLFASLSTMPRGAWSLAGLLACGVTAVYSTPLAALLAPFWLLRCADGALRGDRREIVAGATLLAAFGLLFVITRKLGAMDPLTVTVAGRDSTEVAFRWSNLATAISYIVMECVLPPRALGFAVSHRSALHVGTVVVLGALVGAAAAQGRRRLVASLGSLSLMVATLGLVLAARPVWNLAMESPTMWPLPRRYTVFPVCCVVLSFVVVLDGIGDRQRRRRAAAIACAVVALAWWPTFAIAPMRDLDWPLWAARLREKLETGSREPLVIPMNPAVFPIRFDTASTR